MPQREYEIIIAHDGTVQVEIRGHPGKSCLEVARLFEEIVGRQTDQQLTREYYEPDQEVRTHLDQFQ
jgi:hypothetical protein